MKKILSFSLLFFLTLTHPAQAEDLTPCSSWPETMTSSELQTTGQITREEDENPHVTHKLLAFQKIGPDLARQVYLLTFTRPNHQIIRVITQNNVTSDECSASGVRKFVVDPSGLTETYGK